MTKPLYYQLNLSKQQFARQLQEQFDKDQSLPFIAKMFNTSATSIFNWSNRLGIKRARATTLRNKVWLIQKYIIEKLNMSDIAAIVGVSYQAVSWWLEKHQIPQRPNSEIQQLANIKRIPSTFHNIKKFRSRGYCGWYKDIFYYRSINEVVWYMLNEWKYQSIISEPFVIENYKPDFLIDNKTIIEIKGNPSNQITELYAKRAKPIIAAGYEYKLIYVQIEFPEEYQIVRAFLRNQGAIPGYGFHITSNLLMPVVKAFLA